MALMTERWVLSCWPIAADVAAYLPAPGSAFELVDGVGHFLHLERPGAIGAKLAG